jgi:hypothetical protein
MAQILEFVFDMNGFLSVFKLVMDRYLDIG